MAQLMTLILVALLALAGIELANARDAVADPDARSLCRLSLRPAKRIAALLTALALLLPTLGAQTAPSATDLLLPRVKEHVAAGDSFEKGGSVRLSDPTGNVMLQEFLVLCDFTADAAATRSITVTLDPTLGADTDYPLKGFDNEAYRLTVTSDCIAVTAASHMGVCRAAATLMQMAEGETAIAGGTLDDHPAFKLRGFMHDVGRSFVSVEELKKEIRLLARFKVNCFHWHLTENQAWRFEVKKYPQLTSAAAATRFAGQYYTQDDCREIDRLCHDYGIVLLPEIDMPGHSAAFERAMGHGMQTDQGVAELKEILEEAASVFAHAPYLHIGADEVAITYPNFLPTMLDKVHELGKFTMAWNPIRGTTVANYDVDLCQLWSTSGREVSGKANIDCRYNYTNHFDVFADLAGIYLSQIYYAPQGSAAIAGEISCPWNDRKTPTQDDIIRQNNTWANTIASACRAWTGGGEGYIETQGAVLPNSGPQYDDFADWEQRFLHWKDRWLADEPIPYVRQTNVRWRLTDMMANGGNAATVLPPETEGPQTRYTLKGQTVGTRLVTGAAVYLRHTWGATVPCVFGDPATGNTAYAWTYIHSDREQTAGALIEFQNYGRSENDPAPAAGQWDRKGSRIWLNGEELTAPSWKNAGKTIGSEVELQDENFTAREPYPVVLKQGWNLVFLKLPYVSSGCRLNKWMWTFVLTAPDGRHALEGIRYSPDRLSDDAAEQLALLISDIETTIAATVSDRIGYYKRESAQPLLDLIAAIRPTLSEELSADERAAQQQQLETAYTTFLATYKDAGINLPTTSTDGDEHWFTLQSKRASRYATSAGAGAAVSGNTALTTAAYWKFTQRTDGTLNIVSRDGLYLSPASQNNTALTAVRQQPAKGWTLSPAAAEGYVIITSGSAQINQTNLANYPLYNWGSGTNTTDEGCQYLIAEAPRLPVESVNYSTDARSYFYHLYTPNRESRYPTAYGDGADIIGQTAPSDAAAWKFVERTDGTVDIVNYTDDTYVSPASAYNTALRTTAVQPSAGWTLKRSGNYFIIYSGSTAQWNQTKSGQNYKLYNWGNQGTPNTSDTGCQYLIVEADVTLPDPQPDALTSLHSTALHSTYYTLDGHPCPQPRHGLFVERRKGMVRKVVR